MVSKNINPISGVSARHRKKKAEEAAKAAKAQHNRLYFLSNFFSFFGIGRSYKKRNPRSWQSFIYFLWHQLLFIKIYCDSISFLYLNNSL